MSINHQKLEKCFRKSDNVKAIKIKGQKAKLIKALTKQQNEFLSDFGLEIQDTVVKL